VTSDYDRALSTAMRVLSMRPHSAYELSRKLSAKGVARETVERVVGRLAEIDLINDERFAHDYIEFGFLRKSWGIRKVRAGLLSKGIDREIIDEVLGGEEARRMEQDGAARFVQKEMGRGGAAEKGREKIVSRLVSRGFSWDTASEAVRGFLSAKPEG
jgi:regulatory protein